MDSAPTPDEFHAFRFARSAVDEVIGHPPSQFTAHIRPSWAVVSLVLDGCQISVLTLMHRREHTAGYVYRPQVPDDLRMPGDLAEALVAVRYRLSEAELVQPHLQAHLIRFALDRFRTVLTTPRRFPSASRERSHSIRTVRSGFHARVRRDSARWNRGS